jgi:hypothetical protein
MPRLGPGEADRRSVRVSADWVRFARGNAVRGRSTAPAGRESLAALSAGRRRTSRSSADACRARPAAPLRRSTGKAGRDGHRPRAGHAHRPRNGSCEPRHPDSPRADRLPAGKARRGPHRPGPRAGSPAQRPPGTATRTCRRCRCRRRRAGPAAGHKQRLAGRDGADAAQQIIRIQAIPDQVGAQACVLVGTQKATPAKPLDLLGVEANEIPRLRGDDHRRLPTRLSPARAAGIAVPSAVHSEVRAELDAVVEGHEQMLALAPDPGDPAGIGARRTKGRMQRNRAHRLQTERIIQVLRDLVDGVAFRHGGYGESESRLDRRGRVRPRWSLPRRGREGDLDPKKTPPKGGGTRQGVRELR